MLLYSGNLLVFLKYACLKNTFFSLKLVGLCLFDALQHFREVLLLALNLFLQLFDLLRLGFQLFRYSLLPLFNLVQFVVFLGQ